MVAHSHLFPFRIAGSIAVGIAALLAFGSMAASAATSTFSVVRLENDGSNLLNLTSSGGSILTAVNFTLAGQTTPTRTPVINGIAFDPADVSREPSYSGNTFTLTGISDIPLLHDGDEASGVSDTSEIYPLIYNSVLSPNFGINPAPSTLKLTLTGLTLNQEYVVQFVFSSNSDSRQVTVKDGIGSSETPGTTGAISYGKINGPQVVTGTFVADGTTQSFDLTSAASTPRVQFSGFTVQAVPEPSTAGLIMLGAGFALGSRRRRNVSDPQ